nr:immunoglobulin light chain junction region [Macaca mulatta]
DYYCSSYVGTYTFIF